MSCTVLCTRGLSEFITATSKPVEQETGTLARAHLDDFELFDLEDPEDFEDLEHLEHREHADYQIHLAERFLNKDSENLTKTDQSQQKKDTNEQESNLSDRIYSWFRKPFASPRDITLSHS